MQDHMELQDILTEIHKDKCENLGYLAVEIHIFLVIEVRLAIRCPCQTNAEALRRQCQNETQDPPTRQQSIEDLF